MGVLTVFHDHPLAAGGAVVVGGFLLYVLLSHGGSGSNPSTYTASPDQNSVAAATALQTAQLQAASVSNQTQAALSANSTNDAAAIELAKINGQTSTNNNTIAAGVALANINAAEQYSALHDTLAAGVATNSQNQETQRLSIATQGSIAQQQLLADALITQSTNQTKAEIAIVGAQSGIAQSQIQANKDIQSQSWLSKIFSDQRLKTDIELVGRLFDGTNIYRYRYVGCAAMQIGVIAQEIERDMPEAVSECCGHKMVDYEMVTRNSVRG